MVICSLLLRSLSLTRSQIFLNYCWAIIDEFSTRGFSNINYLLSSFPQMFINLLLRGLGIPWSALTLHWNLLAAFLKHIFDSLLLSMIPLEWSKLGVSFPQLSFWEVGWQCELLEYHTMTFLFLHCETVTYKIISCLTTVKWNGNRMDRCAWSTTQASSCKLMCLLTGSTVTISLHHQLPLCKANFIVKVNTSKETPKNELLYMIGFQSFISQSLVP